MVSITRLLSRLSTLLVREAGAVEEEQAKVNPATGEAIENSDIAKTHKLIQRYTRLGETDPIESNRKAYQSRVEELQQELRTKYFTKDAGVW